MPSWWINFWNTSGRDTRFGGIVDAHDVAGGFTGEILQLLTRGKYAESKYVDNARYFICR